MIGFNAAAGWIMPVKAATDQIRAIQSRTTNCLAGRGAERASPARRLMTLYPGSIVDHRSRVRKARDLASVHQSSNSDAPVPRAESRCARGRASRRDFAAGRPLLTGAA